MPNMDIDEIRRANLRVLEKETGGIRSLSEKVGMSYTQCLNYRNGVPDSKTGKLRGMRKETAWRFEDQCNKPRGWLDQQHDSENDDLHEDEYQIKNSRVPVVGTAQLGDDGYFDALEYPVGSGDGYVLYPVRDQNTYALRVKGNSMRPRIKPGEFVVIEPNHSVSPGDEVMVRTVNGRSMIKVLSFRRDGLIELASVNENEKPITLEEIEVEKIHYVGGILKAGMYYKDAV